MVEFPRELFEDQKCLENHENESPDLETSLIFFSIIDFIDKPLCMSSGDLLEVEFWALAGMGHRPLKGILNAP